MDNVGQYIAVQYLLQTLEGNRTKPTRLAYEMQETEVTDYSLFGKKIVSSNFKIIIISYQFL